MYRAMILAWAKRRGCPPRLLFPSPRLPCVQPRFSAILRAGFCPFSPRARRRFFRERRARSTARRRGVREFFAASEIVSRFSARASCKNQSWRQTLAKSSRFGVSAGKSDANSERSRESRMSVQIALASVDCGSSRSVPFRASSSSSVPTRSCEIASTPRNRHSAKTAFLKFFAAFRVGVSTRIFSKLAGRRSSLSANFSTNHFCARFRQRRRAL